MHPPMNSGAATEAAAATATARNRENVGNMEHLPITPLHCMAKLVTWIRKTPKSRSFAVPAIYDAPACAHGHTTSKPVGSIRLDPPARRTFASFWCKRASMRSTVKLGVWSVLAVVVVLAGGVVVLSAETKKAAAAKT